MQANRDRIRTTHVGSLVRPPELVAYMRHKLSGETIDEPAFEQILKREIARVVRRQVDAGLDIVNDGEFSKTSWYRYVTERLGGLEFCPVCE